MARETKAANAAKPTGANNALAGALISLILPGLGLLLSERRKMAGVLIFMAVVVVDMVAFVVGGVGAALCFIPIVFLFAIPIAHLLAALHSYDVLTKEAGGNPFLFK